MLEAQGHAQHLQLQVFVHSFIHSFTHVIMPSSI